MPKLNDAVKKLDEIKIECCNCGGEMREGDGIEEAGEMYCEDCHSECFLCCEECGQYFLEEDGVNACSEYFCSDSCAHDHGYNICEDCDRWHVPEGYVNAAGDGICENCADDYGSCEGCSETFHSGDLDDDGYCEDCSSEYDENRVIQQYDYRPRAFLYEKMPWENTIYLGIELEVECGVNDDGDYANREELAGKVMEWLEKKGVGKRAYIKEDGSLKNGFEIVFHPSTLQAIHKKFPMREFLIFLRKLGLRAHEPGTCGLHVHISKSKMSSNHLLAGKLFFWKCAGMLRKLSARSGFDYCKFDNYMPKSPYEQENGRYSAFNTCATDDTVEIRVFRGCLEYDRFLASLQFSDLFGEYIQQASIPRLQGVVSDKVIWAEFVAFAKSKSKYGQFLKYCKKNNIV